MSVFCMPYSKVCRHFGCTLPGSFNGLCKYHICTLPGCNNEKSSSRKYCNVHNCPFCDNFKEPWEENCDRHIYIKPQCFHKTLRYGYPVECNNPVIDKNPNSKYCLLHQCPICKGDKHHEDDYCGSCYVKKCFITGHFF